jgi:glutaredoxin 2
MIFGLKGVAHRLNFLAYDDVATPTELIGKKLAPILHVYGNPPMGESLDIIRRIDEDPKWGPPMMQALRPAGLERF